MVKMEENDSNDKKTQPEETDEFDTVETDETVDESMADYNVGESNAKPGSEVEDFADRALFEEID